MQGRIPQGDTGMAADSVDFLLGFLRDHEEDYMLDRVQTLISGMGGTVDVFLYIVFVS